MATSMPEHELILSASQLQVATGVMSATADLLPKLTSALNETLSSIDAEIAALESQMAAPPAATSNPVAQVGFLEGGMASGTLASAATLAPSSVDAGLKILKDLKKLKGAVDKIKEGVEGGKQQIDDLSQPNKDLCDSIGDLTNLAGTVSEAAGNIAKITGGAGAIAALGGFLGVAAGFELVAAISGAISWQFDEYQKMIDKALADAKANGDECPPGDSDPDQPTPPPQPTDPLVIDLNGDGVKTTKLGASSAYFDMDGDGFAEKTAWVDVHDGLLAIDRNSDGMINGVSELFGSRNRAGFSALSDLDSNFDGQISSADQLFEDLRIWRDANQDGISNDGELKSFAETGIASIDLSATPALDLSGNNPIVATSTVSFLDGRTQAIADVVLQVSSARSKVILPDGYELNPEAQLLPQLMGYGNIADLRFAMSEDSVLRGMVKAFVLNSSAMTGADMRSAFETILLKWIGVDEISPDARGPYVNAQHLAVYEKVFDTKYVVERGWGAGAGNPTPIGAYDIELQFKDFADAWFTRFAIQILDSKIGLANGDPSSVVDAVMSNLSALVGVKYNENLNSVTTIALNDEVRVLKQILSPPVDMTDAEALTFFDQVAGILPGLKFDLFGNDRSAFESILRGASVDIQDKALAEFAIQRALGHSLAVGSDGSDTVKPLLSPFNLELANWEKTHIVPGYYSNLSLYDHTPESPADLIFGSKGDDVLSGSNGNDSYVFLKGDGADIVNERLSDGALSFNDANDKLLFVGRHINDAILTASGNDLVITFRDGTADQVTIKNQFLQGQISSFRPSQIEKLVFADGELDVAQKMVVTGTSGNDVLAGFSIATIFTGGQGTDTLQGRSGNDEFVYRLGDGEDVIDATSGDGRDVIRFSNLSSTDVSLSRAGQDLVITINRPEGGSMTVADHFRGDVDKRIEKLTFADGTTWNAFEIGIKSLGGIPLGPVVSGTSGNDVVSGSVGNEVLDGGEGSDELHGSDGTDVYVFNRGYGNDILTYDPLNTASPTRDSKIVQIGLNQDEVWATRSGIDLVLTLTTLVAAPDGSPQRVPTTETLTIENAFASAWDYRFDFADGTQIELSALLIRSNTATTLFVAGGPPADFTFERIDIDGSGFTTALQISKNGTVVATVADQFVYGSRYGYNNFLFEDGTKLGRADIAAAAKLIGSDQDEFLIDGPEYATLGGTEYNEQIEGRGGNDELSGGNGDDILIGGIGDDTLYGDRSVTLGANRPDVVGSDTYIYSKGDGNDVIHDSGVGGFDSDRIVLTDLLRSDIILTKENYNSASENEADLVIKVVDTGEVISVVQQFFNDTDGIELIQFADGSTINRQEILTNAPFVFASGIYVYDPDTFQYNYIPTMELAGRYVIDGSDQYAYVRGTGTADSAIFRGGSIDQTLYGIETLRLEDVGAEDVLIERVGDNLQVTVNATGAIVTVAGYFSADKTAVDYLGNTVTSALSSIVFGDGTVWDNLQINAAAISSGTSGDDNLVGLPEAEKIDAGAGNDTVAAGAGDDTIIGNAGQDVLLGENGNDRIVATFNDGNDAIDGGLGTDTYDASNILTSVSISLVSGTATGTDIGLDTLTSIERAIGGAGGDILHGDDLANTLEGGRGEDLIIGEGGDDILIGGRDADVLDGGAGNDTISYRTSLSGVDVSMIRATGLGGDAAGDTIINVENVLGSNYSDMISGDNGANSLDLGNGNDTAYGQGGDDQILGGAGDDVIDGGIGADRIEGGAGRDRIIGGDGDDIIIGGRGLDELSGGVGSDRYIWSAGDSSDVIGEVAATGIDTLSMRQIRVSDVSVFRFRNDLVLRTVNGEELRVPGHFADEMGSGLESITFDDGTAWDRTYIEATAISIGNTAPVALLDELTASSGQLLSIQSSSLLGNDFEANQDSLSVVSVQNPENGTVALGNDGSITFVPANGFVGTAGFEYTISDGFGGTSVGSVKVAVSTSENAPPTISSVALASVNEDEVQSGQVTAVDPDGDQIVYSIKAGFAPSKGDVTFSANGVFSYNPHSNSNGADSFTVVVSDGKGGTAEQSVSVVIVPVNDAPVAVVDSVATDEDTPVNVNVVSNDIDIDGDAITLLTATAIHGSVSVSGGVLSYSPDPDFYGNDVVTYQISDGNGGSATGSLAVTINPVNDAAVLSSTIVALGETDAPLSTGGTLTITDIDSAAAFVAQTNVAGTNGTFSIDATGAWTYVASSAFNNLNVGDSVTDTFTVSAVDGTTSTVKITINGTNDAAALSSAVVDLLETNDAPATGGSLTILDVDNPAAFVAQTNVTGANGTFSIDSAGAWTYVASSAFDNLNVGDSVSDTFTVLAADGTTTTVKVTINGTNDAAVLSSAIVSHNETDVALSTGGTLTITDIDSTAAFIAQTGAAGANGTFSIDASGNWAYTANSAFDNLNVGDSLSDTFTVAAVDGTTSTVRVAINGTNDAAILSSAIVSLAETNTAYSTGGTLTVTDVDSSATFVAQTNTAGTNGTFSIDETGTWSYVENSAFDSLNVSDSVSDTFTIAAADGTTTTVKVTINGTNDSAVLSSAVVALAETDAALTTGGTLTVTDIDNPATFIAQTNVTGANGTFSIDAAGAWTYVANSAFDSLNAGQSVSDTFTVTSADGTTTTVKVTINGTNDAPVISGAVIVAATEDGAAVTVSALANASDVDGTASALGVTSLPATLPAGVTYNATSKTFSLNPADPAYQHLVAGATQTVTVNYAVSDGIASTPASVSFTVSGTNDAATIAGTAVSTVTEDSTLTASGALTVTDVDDGQSTFQAGSYTASYGSLSLSANGAWTYTLNNSLAAVQGLNTGQTLADTVTVRSADGTAKVIAITINGQNESTSSILGTAGSDILFGTSASDVIDAKGGADIVLAGLGDDRITGGAGSDILYGDTGNDTFIATLNDGSDIYVGGEGSDTYDLSAISTAVSISLSNGFATGSQIGTDVLVGIENVIGGSANDTLDGNSLSNLLAGGAGADTLSGGAGNDRLIGGAGNDALNGGTGNDTFVFLPGFGKDVVSGFAAGAASGDVLEIGLGTAYDTLAEILANAAQSGANTVLTFDANTSITLQNVNKTALLADDFHFV